MVIAALVSFAILLVAWIAAPDQPRSLELVVADAESPAAEPPAAEPHPIAA